MTLPTEYRAASRRQEMLRDLRECFWITGPDVKGRCPLSGTTYLTEREGLCLPQVTAASPQHLPTFVLKPSAF